MEMAAGLVSGLSFVWIIYGLVWLLPLVYLVARWRSYRENQPHDPQLGLKAALLFFRTLAYQIVLAGTAAFLIGLFQGDEGTRRIALGLLLGGGIIYAVTTTLVQKRTNNDAFPMLLRLFTGCNLGLTGLVAATTIIACSVMIMLPDAGGDTILSFLAGMLVYLPAAATQAFLLMRRSGGWQPPRT